MNAAYRYWDTIGWYPDYYCCLDDQLMKTHHEEINRLYEHKQIQSMFLHRSFFEYHPDKIGNPDFTSFDQVSSHWYNKNAKALGLPKLYHLPPFQISDTSKITTGSHSVRYAAYKGHDKIALMGIDLRYTEIISEAAPTEGVGLRITETPKNNPNYFFDGYQKAGDLYNIPNPAAHDGNLHPKSFELLASDFAANGVNVEIVNTNPHSVLNDCDVIPFESIESVLGESALGAVFIPTNVREIAAIINNFRLWNTREYSPSLGGSDPLKPALVIVFNNDTGLKFAETITREFEDSGMGRYFSELRFEYLSLHGERDVYIRDYKSAVGEAGFKAGPNSQFFGSLRATSKYGKYAFLMETDCLPVRRGWLSKLQQLVNTAEPFWVMGSAYRGTEVLGESHARHINGNAIYAVGDPQFQEFVSAFWEPQTWRLIRDEDKRLAYDCVLERLFSGKSMNAGEVLSLWKQHAHKFRYTDYIQNISAKSDLEKYDGKLKETLRHDSPYTFVLHNRAAHQLACSQLENPYVPEPDLLTPSAYPRLLVIDMTPMANGTATGDLKSTLFEGWPSEKLLQVASLGKDKLGLVRLEGARSESKPADWGSVCAAIDEFSPDAILYRPVPNVAWLHELAMSTVRRLKKPLLSWIMDDWPAELAETDPIQWAQLEPDLLDVLGRSSARLSICSAMSTAFETRYGQTFTALANGVLPEDWAASHVHEAGSLTLRYAGGLATNMTRDSVLRIARAVETLAEQGLRIKLEINTQAWWLRESRALFEAFEHTVIESRNRSGPEYRAWLQGADVTIIAYNFDPTTHRYVQYSFANKLPECLASGSVLFAHGPRGLATIDYLASSGAAAVVSANSDAAVEDEIRKLFMDPALRNTLSARGRALAFSRHNLLKLREEFRALVANSVPALTDNRQSPRSANYPGEFLARLARTYQSKATVDRQDAVLLLRTFATAVLVDPDTALAASGPDSALGMAIQKALASLPATDALRQHVGKVTERARGVTARAAG